MADEYTPQPDDSSEGDSATWMDQAAKTAQTLALVQQAKQEEAAAQGKPLPQAMPQMPPQGPPLAGAAYQEGRGIGVLNPPTSPASQGRMYMGPAMSPQQEQQFSTSAPGTRINLMPPPPANAQDQRAAALQSVPGAQNMEDVQSWRNVAATDKPGVSTTLPGVQRPRYEGQDVFEAQQNIQDAIRNGMDPGMALQTYGGPLLAGQLGRKGVGAQQREQPRWVPADPNTGAPGHFETSAGAVRFAPTVRPPAAPKPPPMDTVRSVIPAVTGKPGVPAVPEIPQKRFLGMPVPFTGKPGSPEVPSIPSSPQRTITERVPAGAMAGTTPVAPPAAPQTAKPEGRPVKDKNGKTWIYTGTATNPRTDKDPSHWVAQ